MKKITKISTSFALLSAFVLVPVISHAQINLDTKIKADLSLVEKAEDNNSSIRFENKNKVEADFEESEDETSEEENESNSRERDSYRINPAGIAVVSAGQVKSEEDLKIFKSNLMVKERGVSKIDFDYDKDGESDITIMYSHKGKFLGFIPVNLKSTTTVVSKENKELEVHSKLPWWSFLVSNKNYIKADLESNIENNVAIKENAKFDATASEKAELLEAVIVEIKAQIEAEASINN